MLEKPDLEKGRPHEPEIITTKLEFLSAVLAERKENGTDSFQALE
jgi:hypothetical protein